MNKIFLFILLVVSFNAFSGFGDLSEDEIASICAATGLTRDELLKNTGTHQNQSVQTADQDPLSALSPQELADALKAESQLNSRQTTSQAERDAVLALSLQQDEEATQRLIQELQLEEQIRTQQMQNDDRAFAEKLSQGFQKQLSIIDNPEKRKMFYEKKGPILEEFGRKTRNKQDMDVHAFNALIKPEFLRLIELDRETLQTKTDHSWQEIHRVLTAFISNDEECKKKHPKAMPFLNGKATGYLQSGVIDKELNIKYPELLSRVWDLCLRVHPGEGEEAHSFQWNGEETRVPSEFLRILSFAYHENLATNGGCGPGYAGRLARTYFMLMKQL